MDRQTCLVNHLFLDQGMAVIPSFTKRRLLDLPLDTETMFAWQFDEVLKETVQAAQIARGSPTVGLLSCNIPKRPATQMPTQFPMFLGSVHDLVLIMAYPSADQIDCLRRLIKRIIKSPASPARLWKSLFGHLASIIQLVTKARRHIRPLQYFIEECWYLSMPDSHLVTLNSEAREEFHWWLHTPNLTFRVPFLDPDPELMVVTDASNDQQPSPRGRACRKRRLRRENLLHSNSSRGTPSLPRETSFILGRGDTVGAGGLQAPMRRGPVWSAEGCESSPEPGRSRPQTNGSSKPSYQATESSSLGACA